MKLTKEEIERYSRQIVLRGVGGPGQNKLKAARVLAIGAGGLGVVDDDVVSLSNLHRQVLHATGNVGRKKVDSAEEAIARLNPHVAVVKIVRRLDEANARALVADWDVVLDGSDNFATRYAVSDACFHEGKPLVTAAIGEYDGALTTLKPYEDGPDGKPNPTYRCLFPEAPPPGTVPTCSQVGVLGAGAGARGARGALEAIREIVGGFGDDDRGLVGRLLMIDTRSMRFETLTYGWDETNPLNGAQAQRLVNSR